MASFARYSRAIGIYNQRPIYNRLVSRIPIEINSSKFSSYLQFMCPSFRAQEFGSTSESAETNFPKENAYEILGVSRGSSFAEIKACFRKLAKETHPDLADSRDESSASRRFVQILAAYEILSDSEKRTHYDRYLLSQEKLVQKHSGLGSKLHVYKSNVTTFKEMEVVEWLKWYRLAINDMLSEKKVVFGTGYFDVLERDFYSAIHAAYYGPEIESMELLPDCFEAEERSSYETPEVLHLVSGRDLFGMVCLTDKAPEISCTHSEKLTSFRSFHSGLCQAMKNVNFRTNAEDTGNIRILDVPASGVSDNVSYAYQDLELHVSGRVVAVASRIPPGIHSDGLQKESEEDHIHIFLNSDEYPKHVSSVSSQSWFASGGVGTRIHLCTIAGLGTSPDESSCFVYNSSGKKTHVIMKHRTFLVKHIHWYQLGDKVSICECRCTRARLPPSKFWLFEPRCAFHDIGGWYVETYGKDKKGRTLTSQRFWDGLDDSEQSDRRLHPAVYLLALAYRTLDLEYAKVRKQTFKNIVEEQLLKILQWCRKLV